MDTAITGIKLKRRRKEKENANTQIMLRKIQVHESKFKNIEKFCRYDYEGRDRRLLTNTVI